MYRTQSNMDERAVVSLPRKNFSTPLPGQKKFSVFQL